MHADIAAVGSLMAALGRILNLKPHTVGAGDGSTVTMAGPGDIGTGVGRRACVYVCVTAPQRSISERTSGSMC
jgi:hypothetical protein